MMGEGRCPLADCFFPPDTRHPERKRRISMRIVSEGKAGKYQSAGRRRIGGIPERKRGPPSAEGQQPCAFARAEGCVASLRGLSGIRRAVFPNTRGFRRLRRPGSSRHRASPWAAPVLPTERAGSKGVFYAAFGSAPFGGWRHHLSPVGKRVTGFSVAQGLPTARLSPTHWILRSLLLPYESSSLV